MNAQRVTERVVARMHTKSEFRSHEKSGHLKTRVQLKRVKFVGNRISGPIEYLESLNAPIVIHRSGKSMSNKRRMRTNLCIIVPRHEEADDTDE